MAATRTGHLVPPIGEGPVREQALHLGPDDHLVGILAGPAEATGVVRPVVIFLNAGVIHRVGPHRLHVLLARRLAERGVTSLRLDLSGIGDSRPVPGALSFRQSSVADTRAAMDRLASETGISRFVVFGLCSGADNALATAAVDDRVVGLVVLDPPVYATSQARARKLAKRVRQLGGVRAVATWTAGVVARRIRTRVAGLIKPGVEPPPGDADEEIQTGGRAPPPLAVYRAQLTGLVARGVEILAVFSGVHGERYNDADQLFELFPELRGKVDRAYFPGANHMFTELAAQATLASTVTAWIERRR